MKAAYLAGFLRREDENWKRPRCGESSPFPLPLAFRI
jgi:hypothetical protein